MQKSYIEYLTLMYSLCEINGELRTSKYRTDGMFLHEPGSCTLTVVPYGTVNSVTLLFEFEMPYLLLNQLISFVYLLHNFDIINIVILLWTYNRY